jgi:hypothetical protein
MAKILTMVPAQPPPPPRGVTRHLVPVADLFMLALLSRPANRTLATTWVTAATLLLAGGCLAGVAALSAALLAGMTRWPAFLVVVAVAACATFAAGAASVVAVGLAQRSAAARRLSDRG